MMGGPFMSLPADYRDYFIRNLHDALSGHTSSNVEEEVCYSEHSAIKHISMTIESKVHSTYVHASWMPLKIPCDFPLKHLIGLFYSRRDDYFLGPHLWQMPCYGCTHFHIYVQSTYKGVARDRNRAAQYLLLLIVFLQQKMLFKVIATRPSNFSC